MEPHSATGTSTKSLCLEVNRLAATTSYHTNDSFEEEEGILITEDVPSHINLLLRET